MSYPGHEQHEPAPVSLPGVSAPLPRLVPWTYAAIAVGGVALGLAVSRMEPATADASAARLPQTPSEVLSDTLAPGVSSAEPVVAVDYDGVIDFSRVPTLQHATVDPQHATVGGPQETYFPPVVPKDHGTELLAVASEGGAAASSDAPAPVVTVIGTADAPATPRAATRRRINPGNGSASDTNDATAGGDTGNTAGNTTGTAETGSPAPAAPVTAPATTPTAPVTPPTTPATVPASPTPAEEEPEAPEPAPDYSEYVDQLVAFYTIGNSDADPARRRVGWNIKSEGWPGFVEKVIRPELDWGFRRIQLHNPFGEDGQIPMEIDQAVRSREDGLDWLTDDFVEAWQPVIRGDYTDGEPVDVIAYIGRTYGLMDDLEAAGDWDAWLARAEESVALPVAAGMSLAFDGFSLVEVDTYSYRFIRMLEDRGVRVYIETWPKKASVHWQNTNVVVNEVWWERNHRHPNVFRRSQLGGEVVRLLIQTISDPDDPTPHATRVTSALVQGYSVAIRPSRLHEEVESMEEILNQAGAAASVAYD